MNLSWACRRLELDDRGHLVVICHRHLAPVPLLLLGRAADSLLRLYTL